MFFKIFLYEWKRQWKRKSTKICFLLLFIDLFLVEFVYIYLLGPIGIFRNSLVAEKFIRTYGVIISIVPKTMDEIYQDFFIRYGTCLDASGQLAREFIDILGSVFCFFSFLIGCFMIGEEQQKKDNTVLKWGDRLPSIYLPAKFMGAMAYTTIFMIVMTVIPFVSSFRLRQEGYTGSPIAFIKYMTGWMLPTILILYLLQMLMSLYVKEKEVRIFLHFVLVFIVNLPYNQYHLYRLIIRFNEVDELFYEEVKRQILINRIFVILLSAVIYYIIVKSLRKSKG